MAEDKTFVYWTSDGVRHEGPIVHYLVPPGCSLITEEEWRKKQAAKLEKRAS